MENYMSQNILSTITSINNGFMALPFYNVSQSGVQTIGVNNSQLIG